MVEEDVHVTVTSEGSCEGATSVDAAVLKSSTEISKVYVVEKYDWIKLPRCINDVYEVVCTRVMKWSTMTMYLSKQVWVPKPPRRISS